MVMDLQQQQAGSPVTPFAANARLSPLEPLRGSELRILVDHHMDDEAGRASGYPGAFGMGNLTFSWLHCMLHEWLGGSGRIVDVECQFRSPVLRGTWR